MDGNKSEFIVVKSFRVHNIKLSEVCAHLVTIKGKPYIAYNAIVILVKKKRKIIVKFINPFLFLLKLGTQ